MSLPGNANRVSSLPAVSPLAILSIPSMRERRASGSRPDGRFPAGSGGAQPNLPAFRAPRSQHVASCDVSPNGGGGCFALTSGYIFYGKGKQVVPDAYRMQMEADALNDHIRGVLTRLVRHIFVIAVVTASFTMSLRWMGEKAALDMAQAFVRYASSIGELPGASSQAALCLCPETMRAFAREGETVPNGIDWHTTEENPEILFRSLQGSSHLEEVWSPIPLPASVWVARRENKSIVFQTVENRTKIWLRFGGRYFWQRADPRWWCVWKWEAHEG